MRTLALDGRMGASGDMLLGALLAAGADPGVLSPVEKRLDVEYVIEPVSKNGIEATSVDVLLADGSPDHEHEDGENGIENRDDHGHEGDHEHAEGAGPTRSYREVRELVGSLGVETEIAADALSVFEALGEAEAAIHGTEIGETHFHEVGADDAVADVVGVCLLLADLGVERIVTTPLSVGGGAVSMAHGRYPVPAPAVVELAERADWSLRGGPVESELLTPTGAAILAHYAEGVESLPTLAIGTSGYGAGEREFDEHPNVLRALVGESEGGLRREDVRVLETTLDDATPEILGGLQDRLTAVGARDVSVHPATMKKSRPGHLVKVIVKPEDAERVAHELAVETGTLGVRDAGVRHRWVAEREVRPVTVEINSQKFEIDVKVASDSGGEVYDVSAEYDDAAAVAAETGRSTRSVVERAERAIEV